jgi:hypothetical protein
MFVSITATQTQAISSTLALACADRTYANDTAVADFFTGTFNFTVKEIEAFESAD